MSDDPVHRPPSQGVHAFACGAIRVAVGANLGDPIGGADDCLPGDIYRLKPEARARRLVLNRPRTPGEAQTIAPGSAIGAPGDRVWPLAILTLLSPEGERLAIVTLWHEASTTTFALPLSPMLPHTDYTLVSVDPDAGGVRLADVISVSFAAGTLITLPGGRQSRIEALAAGDAVLTRDSGPQPLRWIAKATLRAAGGLAPVVISAGTLGNSADLVVSPHHRLFIYQRGARRLTGAAEILVQAKHLVDGDRVWRREGGFVDYYSLIFDRHEIIYAEGIPAESLMITDETVRHLSDELADELHSRFPGLRHSPHFAREAGRGTLGEAGAAALFRKDGGA